MPASVEFVWLSEYLGYVVSTVKYSVMADEFMLPAVSLQEKVTLWLPSPTVVRLFQLPEELVMVMFAALSREYAHQSPGSSKVRLNQIDWVL